MVTVATKPQAEIFRSGSKTYFNSSLFFPPNIRDQVFDLYAFVRVADDLVDRLPQDKDGFLRFTQSYRKSLSGIPSGDPVIDDFVILKKEKEFPDEWIDAFLNSMEADLGAKHYSSMEDLMTYIYGSAEVIGLFMCKILNLPKEAWEFAIYQGRAMQYINFVRDIDEDFQLGRRYLLLEGSELPSLDRETALANRESFCYFVRRHLSIYETWQNMASKGYKLIPRRFQIAVRTASDMYAWTAKKIRENPLVVFERKVKPSKARIFRQAILNAIKVCFV